MLYCSNLIPIASSKIGAARDCCLEIYGLSVTVNFLWQLLFRSQQYIIATQNLLLQRCQLISCYMVRIIIFSQQEYELQRNRLIFDCIFPKCLPSRQFSQHLCTSLILICTKNLHAQQIRCFFYLLKLAPIPLYQLCTCNCITLKINIIVAQCNKRVQYTTSPYLQWLWSVNNNWANKFVIVDLRLLDNRAQTRILNQGEQIKPRRNLGISGGMLPQEILENLGVNVLNFGQIFTKMLLNIDY